MLDDMNSSRHFENSYRADRRVGDASVGSNNLYSLKSSIKTEKSHFFFHIPISLRNLHLPVSFHGDRIGYRPIIAYLRKYLIELLGQQFVFVCPGLSPLARVASEASN